jgi:hypothetical protein
MMAVIDAVATGFGTDATSCADSAEPAAAVHRVLAFFDRPGMVPAAADLRLRRPARRGGGPASVRLRGWPRLPCQNRCAGPRTRPFGAERLPHIFGDAPPVHAGPRVAPGPPGLAWTAGPCLDRRASHSGDQLVDVGEPMSRRPVLVTSTCCRLAKAHQRLTDRAIRE